MAIAQAFDRLETFTVLAPTGTTPAAPQEVATRFVPGVVVGIGIIIPPGHGGSTGIALGVAHQPIIPEAKGAYLISDDEKIEWPLEGQPTSGQWSAFVYNTDSVVHNFYLRYFVVEVANAAGASSSSLVAPLII